MVCEAIQSTKTKCGFSRYHKFACFDIFTDLGYGTSFTYTGCSAEFGDCAYSVSGDPDPDKLYLTQVRTFTGTGSTPPPGGCAVGCAASGTQFVTDTYDPDTCLSSQEIEGDVICVEPGSCANCECRDSHLVCGGEGGVFPCEDGSPCIPDTSHGITGGATLANEYTTELLCETATDALPDYTDTWVSCGEDGSAFRDISPDETTCTIQRFKFKVEFDVSDESRTLNWIEHFEPEDVGENPTDTPHSHVIAPGEIEFIHEVFEPDTEGTITVTDITMSDGTTICDSLESLLSDGYWDAGYTIKMLNTGTDIFQIVPYVYDSGGGIFKAGVSVNLLGSVEVIMSLSDFFNNWHEVSLQVLGNGDASLCAYGETFTGSVGAPADIDQLFVGSDQAFPGFVNMYIRNIKLLANPDSEEEDFIFPETSFDSAVGTGQSISGATVRVISDDAAMNGYIKNLDPAFVITTPP